MTRICDGCHSSNAAMFCSADMAYMCLGCDLKVHGANKLASRHERVWMCEVCEHAPAAVICKADAAALCSDCDRDIHSANPLASRHDRVPVTPFFECPNMIKVAHVNATSVVPNNVNNHDHLWPPPPPLPAAASFDLDSLAPNLSLDSSFLDLGGYGSREIALRHTRSAAVVPDSSSSMSEISNPYGIIDYLCPPMGSGHQPLLGQEAQPKIGREERVMRYREKKKNRKFEKTVRYASRKAYAEIRPRVKGRFVKRSSVSSSSSDAVEQFIISSIADGLVPSFC